MKKTIQGVLLATLITFSSSTLYAATTEPGTGTATIEEASQLYLQASKLPTDSLQRAQLLDQAIAILQGLTKQDSKNLEAYRRLFGVYLLQQDYGNSIKTIQRAITLSPEDPKLFITLAFLYEHTGDLEYSKEMLKHAIELAPTNELALSYLPVVEKKLKALLDQTSSMQQHPGGTPSTPLPSSATQMPVAHPPLH